jgi:hypothetical protein
MWVVKIDKIVFNSLYSLLFQLHDRKSMFAATHSDINSLKSGLLHLIGKLKGRSAKDKDGIILETKLFGNNSVIDTTSFSISIMYYALVLVLCIYQFDGYFIKKK